MDENKSTAAAPEAHTNHQAEMPQSSAPLSAAKTTRLKKVLLVIAISVGSSIALAMTVGMFLVVVGAGLFVSTLQGYNQAATTRADQIVAQMKQLRINGMPPHTVVGGITDRDGEDLLGTGTVPTVDATFLVSAPAVTVAQSQVHKDLAVSSAKPLTVSTVTSSTGTAARGLEEFVVTSNKTAYNITYFFPALVPISLPDPAQCIAMPRAIECNEGQIIATNHLLSRPVANIRVSV